MSAKNEKGLETLIQSVRIYSKDIGMEFGWLVGWLVLWHTNLCRLFNAKSIFIQIINSISNSLA